MRKNGYPCVPLKADPIFADVELTRGQLSDNIYVINLDYAEK